MRVRAGVEGEAHVRRVQLADGRRGARPDDAPGRQRRLAPGRERQQVRRARGSGRPARAWRAERAPPPGDVRVGAAHAERAHARAAAASPERFQGWSAGRDEEGRALQRMRGLSRAEVQVLGDRLVLERQHRLDQAGDARRRLQVADVRLHRAERAARAVRPRRCPAPRAAPRPRSGRRAACRCRAPRRSRWRRAPPSRSPAPGAAGPAARGRWAR